MAIYIFTEILYIYLNIRLYPQFHIYCAEIKSEDISIILKSMKSLTSWQIANGFLYSELNLPATCLKVYRKLFIISYRLK
jgi:hypothetical protein